MSDGHEHCANCQHFRKGYRLQGLKVPDFCNWHFHSPSHDDPACDEFKAKEQAR
jgi:hypothetical protein